MKNLLGLKALALPLAALAAILAARGLAAPAEKTLALPPHPRLLFNAQGIEALKQKIRREPWAAVWAQYKRNVDKDLDAKLDLPPRGGNWSHNYVCPVHGAHLKQGKPVGPWQWEHICSVGPHVLRSDPGKASLDFDGCVIARVHGSYAEEIIDCGLVYQVTGDPRYAARAREILLAYADRYLAYPLHDNQGKPRAGGHIASQSLSEASWLILACQGADLVWTTLSEADRRTVADRLVRPAVREIILPVKLGIHNIQCHHNSAIGLAGFLLDDAELVRLAIDNPDRGYRTQMAKGVQEDGVWCEGSWGYHFYTIVGVWPLTEAARNCGIDLYGPPFKRMFDAPLAQANPGLVLPPFNDSGEVRLPAEADLYELAYARYKDPKYAALLASSKRTGRMALFYGADALPKADVAVLGSRNSAASGYAALQRGQGSQATWLCLKYGPYGGGHGHLDKLNFVLYAGGEAVALDSGTRRYGSPLHYGWDKTTVAHNTLVVDGKSQEPATGKCLAFGNAGGIDYVTADAGPIYHGVRFVRTAALLDENLAVFIDQVRCDKPHTLDIAYHQRRQWDAVPPGSPWPTPSESGYKYIEGATSRTSRDGLRATLRLAGDRLSALTVAGGETTEFITGTGIGSDSSDRVPMALLRRQAQQTAFAWSVALDGTAAGLEILPVRAAGKPVPPDEALALRVTHGRGTWTLLVNPGKLDLRVSLPGPAEWTCQEPFAIYGATGR